LFSGRIKKNTRIPFAPFLTVGSIGAYFIDYNILLKI
jgi:prepilin signal peptidase PulO-like enzyme (type II secretory pathway)